MQLIGQAARLVQDEPMATGKTVSVDWERLVAQHQRAVLLTLLSRGVRLDRARDIVQETWARLIAHERTGRLTR